jgi:S-adenosylmethionine synthetase
MGRVACETLVTTGMALIAGRDHHPRHVDFAADVRRTIEDIGYTRPTTASTAEHCAVLVAIDRSRRTSPRAWTPAEPATRA